MIKSSPLYSTLFSISSILRYIIIFPGMINIYICINKIISLRECLLWMITQGLVNKSLFVRINHFLNIDWNNWGHYNIGHWPNKKPHLVQICLNIEAYSLEFLREKHRLCLESWLCYLLKGDVCTWNLEEFVWAERKSMDSWYLRVGKL